MKISDGLIDHEFDYQIQTLQEIFAVLSWNYLNT